MEQEQISQQDMVLDVKNSIRDMILVHNVAVTEINEQLIEQQATAIVIFIITNHENNNSNLPKGI